MSKIEPVAYANLSRWLSGREWPDDCFSERIGGDISDPLYTAAALREIERRTIERCAKVCDDDFNNGWTAEELAAAIRALPSEAEK